MDNKNFDVVKVILPKYENAFIFDVVDNTNIASACYLLCQKDNQVIVNKIVDLMTLLGDYPIKSTAITNDEFNTFLTLLKQWMSLENNYSKLNIDGLNDTPFIETVNEQEYELIRSFVHYGSRPFIVKKH